MVAQSKNAKKSPAEVLASVIARQETAYWQNLAKAPATTTTSPPVGVVAGVDLKAYLPMIVLAGAVFALLKAVR